MSVRAKLTLFSMLLIAAVVIVACVMVFSFAKASVLKTAYDSSLSDYERFYDALGRTRIETQSETELARASFLRYAFIRLYGSMEYALQAGDEILSNNTGIDAYRYLKQSGVNAADHYQTQYGYVSVGDASYLIIGRDISIDGRPYHLSLVRDITVIYRQISALAVKCLMLCVALLSVAAVCMAFVVRGTMKPLSVLQTGVKRVASGNYNEYIHIQGNNEFSELAESYNEMAKAVDDRIHEIEKTSEDRKLLLSALSHEMRTPVTAIAAYAHTLSHVKMSDAQKLEAVSFISDECLRLERLSSKLMQLISLNNRAPLAFETVSSGKLIQIIEPLIAPAAAENGIAVDFDNPAESLYRLETDLIVCLLTNLFDNARKAGANNIKIAFCEHAISVSDNGCGIPPEKFAAITEPFYKLDPSRNTEGFGLGLTIVKRIAEAHNAELRIESKVSEGTTVSVLF